MSFKLYEHEITLPAAPAFYCAAIQDERPRECSDLVGELWREKIRKDSDLEFAMHS